MRFAKFAIFILFLLKVFIVSGVQEKEDLIFTCYDSSNGMPQNSATAFAGNSMGFVYIATQEGVVKFDGLIMEVFDRNTLPGLPSNLIRDIAVGEDDSIFVATTKGLVLFNRKANVINDFAVLGKTSTPDVISIAYSAQEKRLVGAVSRKGIFSYSVEKDETVLFETSGRSDLLNTNKVFAADSGEIYAGTRDGVYFQEKAGDFEKVEGLNDFITALAQDREGSIYAGGRNGLYKLRNGKLIRGFSEETGASIKNVTALFVDSSNNLLIGHSGKGLLSYNGNGLKKISFNSSKGMENVAAIFEDKEKNIWAGGLSKGFCIAKKSRMSATYGKEHLVMGITEDLTGDIWMNSLGKGAVKVNRKKGTHEIIKEKIGTDLRSVYSDRAGRTWVFSKDKGVFISMNGDVFKEAAAVFEGNLSDFPLNGAIFFEDKNGAVWTDNRDRASRVYSFFNNRMTFFDLPEKNCVVTDIIQNRKGEILVSTLENGVFKRDSVTGKFMKVSFQGRNFFIHNMLYDSKDRLWMATHNSGIFIAFEGDIINLTVEKGLFHDAVHSMLEDRSGSFWFSTNKGLFSISSSEIECFLNGKCLKVYSTVYLESDGMPSRECNGGSRPSMIQTADGTIWVPTIKGAVNIDPLAEHKADGAPAVTLTWLIINNDVSSRKRIYDLEKISLPKGTKEVEIQYSAPVFKNPSKVSFSYCLNENCSVKSTDRRYASFNNISPGDYRFKVRAFYEDRNENDYTEKSITFTIEPFFYETGNFRNILLFVSFMSILFAFLLNRRSSYLKEQEMTSVINEKTFKLELANNELTEAVMRDPLTGLRNRRYLFEKEEEGVNEFMDMLALTKLITTKNVFAVMLIDIDHFKRVNDYYGHASGDMVLKDFSAILKENAGEEGVVVRWGGEEFLILLKNTTYEAAVAVSENIRKRVEKHRFTTDDGKDLWLTCSIGLSLIPFFKRSPDFLSFDNIISLADLALYHSKSSGRDRITIAKSGNSLPANMEQLQDMLVSYDYAEINGFYKFEVLEKENFEEFEI